MCMSQLPVEIAVWWRQGTQSPNDWYFSLLKKLCSPAGYEGWDVVILDYFYLLLCETCQSKVFGFILHWPCGGGSAGCVLTSPFGYWCTNSWPVFLQQFCDQVYLASYPWPGCYALYHLFLPLRPESYKTRMPGSHWLAHDWAPCYIYNPFSSIGSSNSTSFGDVIAKYWDYQSSLRLDSVDIPYTLFLLLWGTVRFKVDDYCCVTTGCLPPHSL